MPEIYTITSGAKVEQTCFLSKPEEVQQAGYHAFRVLEQLQAPLQR